MFHDAIADLDQPSLRDVAALEAAGYEVEKALEYGDWPQPESFRTALVRRDGNKVALAWAHDSAFRFFPIVQDPLLGWSLHLFDMVEEEIIRLADTQLDMSIGVAFVDKKGEPGWIGDNPELKIHHGSMRGCWPVLSAVEES